MVKRYVREYSALHELACLIESALSLQIFWIMASHFTVVFSILSKILGFYGYSDPAYNLENSAFTAFQGPSFFVIIFFASKVNSADEKLRRGAKSVAFQLSLKREHKECSELLDRFIQSKERIVLTAWGVFHFTRSFLFTSAGVLISYNLLILQLNAQNEKHAEF
ncbi:hypothetical protein AVEN_98533-1 [Araneus ventricosus]|uniref:Uncharacterized protein n=1 Tax=Araneus ventricosus TaxID=182803 RepID=A0A4Y2K6W2_ARAVE|nr:hypothetical protein AVEN_98533-1 [Araneus ventricosus]